MSAERRLNYTEEDKKESTSEYKLFSIYASNRITKQKENLVLQYTWDYAEFRENPQLWKI